MPSGLLRVSYFSFRLLVTNMFLGFHLQPSRQPMSTREGSEPDTFWDLLGGKTEYPKEKETRKQVEEPRLFTCSCNSGNGKHLFEFVFFSSYYILLFSYMVQLYALVFLCLT